MKKVNPSGIKMELLLHEKLKTKIKPYGPFQRKSTYHVREGEEKKEEKKKRRKKKKKKKEKREERRSKFQS